MKKGNFIHRPQNCNWYCKEKSFENTHVTIFLKKSRRKILMSSLYSTGTFDI